MLTWSVEEGKRVGGTWFREYLMDGPKKEFAEAVAKLITLSGQDPIAKSDKYKTSVEFEGMFDGEVFTLYDYKGDWALHIGGTDSLNVEGLIAALDAALATATPTPFATRLHYDDAKTRYGWPNYLAGKTKSKGQPV